MKRINLGEGELSIQQFPQVGITRIRWDAFPGTGYGDGSSTCSHKFMEVELSKEETAQLVTALQEP